ncbi:uncharacterized protein ACIBXB_001365 [Morphnus guianensis]
MCSGPGAAAVEGLAPPSPTPIPTPRLFLGQRRSPPAAGPRRGPQDRVRACVSVCVCVRVSVRVCPPLPGAGAGGPKSGGPNGQDPPVRSGGRGAPRPEQREGGERGGWMSCGLVMQRCLPADVQGVSETRPKHKVFEGWCAPAKRRSGQDAEARAGAEAMVGG